MNGSRGTDSQSKADLLSGPGPGSPRGTPRRGQTLPFCLCPSPGSTGPAAQTSSPALALSRSAPSFPPRVWPPGDSVASVLHRGTRATASTQASEREPVPTGFSNELLPLPGWPCELPGIESSCFRNQDRRGQEQCQRNPKGLTAAEPSSTPGQPVLPAFEAITGFTVRLFRDPLSKSEDCLGQDGMCSDFVARFTEAGLASQTRSWGSVTWCGLDVKG
uniref:Uncharacterized protein n=1 Tax=Rangifer tarandus platyrhynchus TaxID=3082113 RepID=A0ACB0E841_RANTA|nr:unnamed protein product [Rangifer tarandus platyrhynchus]